MRKAIPAALGYAALAAAYLLTGFCLGALWAYQAT